MESADLLSLLRRLSHARPGPGVLNLPPRLSPHEALQAIRAALKALEPETPSQLTKTGDWTRIHIDGGSRGNPGPAGVGVMIVGPDGQAREQIHRYIGEATNNVAEYHALLLALERARALGCTDLDVYSDSELLVRQIQGRYQVKNAALRPLYVKALERIAGFRHFKIQHVPREQNMEADALANRGMDEASRASGRGAGVGPVGGEW
ncbi:MAG TPA: ribonuclease HI family protein [Candidatus Methylomirabilis sp.]|nr:ribonuclease HI family protein [Candidatus Methylomirabilis sp.]